MARIFFDLESTGTDPNEDRITQFAFTGFGLEYQSLINPRRPIPPDVQELTGITDTMVADSPKFADVATEILNLIAGHTLVGFGCIGFDVPLLSAEFERAGVPFELGPVIDCGNIFRINCPRNLAAAHRHYLGYGFEGAHTAMADAEAVMQVFFGQLTRHELRDKTDAELAILSNHGRRMADPAGKLAYDEAGQLCFNTFKNKGIPVLNDVGYAEWMLRGSFPIATARMIHSELQSTKKVNSPGLFGGN